MNPASAPHREDSVFNRPLHLAGILDDCADELAGHWFGYEWNDRTRCNCGIVARQIMQVNPRKLKKLLPPVYDQGAFRPSWRSMTEAYCADTGLDRNEVFARLLSVGLQINDFSHLEDLSDPEILERIAPHRRDAAKPIHRSRKSDVVAYLRTWALGIEQFHDQAAPPAPLSARPAVSS